MTSPLKGTMWGGRFERPPNELFYEFQRSFPIDRLLLPYQLAVDRAWTRALERARVLTSDEATKIQEALEQIANRALDEPAWLDDSVAEDVHDFMERAVTERLGPLGHKLHTGRSRNELVVTEFRMYVKDASKLLRSALATLLRTLIDQAERYLGLPMPGHTHLQRAQPILYSHFLMSHAEAFFHDLDRLAAAAYTSDACPMGSGALAGCAFPIDREAIARDLGFSRLTRNSLDAVSRRDFALDYLYALAVLSTHLSRMAEDFVLFASQEFGFIHLPDEFSTGSSIMPQKKNPDAWELIRGKSARVTSALFSLLTTLKGLPSSYQRDLQEDKEPLFAAHEQAHSMVLVAAAAIKATRPNEVRLREAASDPALLATEAADYLVRRGIPFRDAHEIVGQIVKEAERQGKPWTQLPMETLWKFCAYFRDDLKDSLSVEAAIAARAVSGGTAPDAVRAAIADARQRLAGVEEKL